MKQSQAEPSSVKTSSLISVLLVDDHYVVLDGLFTVLDADRRLKVVGRADNGRRAVEMTRRLQPDVVVMDVQMPILNGIEATREIRRENPSVKILMFSMFDNDEYIQEAIAAGINGYVLKDDPTELLSDVVCSVAAGNAVFNHKVSAALLGPPAGLSAKKKQAAAGSPRLTPRQVEILGLICEGLSSQQIATRLSRSVNTVNNHKKHIMRAMGVHKCTTLITKAVELGLISSSEN